MVNKLYYVKKITIFKKIYNIYYMSYYDKYLKYKNKYLNLKKSLDGGSNYTQEDIENMSPADIDMLFESQERYQVRDQVQRQRQRQERDQGQGQRQRQGQGQRQRQEQKQKQGHRQGQGERERQEQRPGQESIWLKPDKHRSFFVPKDFVPKDYDENSATKRAIIETTEEDKSYQKIIQSHRSYAEHNGMRLVKVDGDGNCLYRAISFGLHHTQEYHARYRQIVVDELRRNLRFYEHFIEGEKKNYETVDEYIIRMGNNKEWGGNIELQAFVNSTGISIRVHDMSIGGTQTIITPDSSIRHRIQGKTLELIFTGNHYNYLRRL